MSNQLLNEIHFISEHGICLRCCPESNGQRTFIRSRLFNEIWFKSIYFKPRPNSFPFFVHNNNPIYEYVYAVTQHSTPTLEPIATIWYFSLMCRVIFHSECAIENFLCNCCVCVSCFFFDLCCLAHSLRRDVALHFNRIALVFEIT